MVSCIRFTFQFNSINTSKSNHNKHYNGLYLKSMKSEMSSAVSKASTTPVHTRQYSPTSPYWSRCLGVDRAIAALILTLKFLQSFITVHSVPSTLVCKNTEKQKLIMGILTICNKGAYLTFKSIFKIEWKKNEKLFKFDHKIKLKSIPGTKQY